MENSWDKIISRYQTLNDQYADLPQSSMINAFQTANFVGGLYTANPYIQNQRVKAISSLPDPYTKDKVGEFLKKPNQSEFPLRQVEHALEWTAYPLFHTRKTYQSLMTYHNYIAPFITNEGDTKKDDFWREYKLLEKLRVKFDLKAFGHQVVGQVGQEGKVFYTYRMSVDKAHNKVNHAFLQQLPSDYTKIVGFNNVSKYTLAFDLMYFAQAGTTPLQFGDLFTPYIKDFNSVVERPSGVGRKFVFGQNKPTVNADRLRHILEQPYVGIEKPDVYYQNGRWFYWVTLPVDKAFTFEADDATTNAISPFAGLFIDMIQLSQYEQLQLELLQNPLISVLTGEIPYFDDKDSNNADQYKLSNGGLALFTAMFYQMMAQNNTSGIGFYAGPFRNMKLESLAEAPSAMDIVSQGYVDTMSKAGLSAIIPVTDDARAGMAQISLSIECKFMETVYECIERMMDAIIESMGLKYDWRFHMFGSIAEDEKLSGELRTAMTLGIASAAIRYAALSDISIFEDISWSDAVFNSGLYERRQPLFTSYTAKAPAANLAPHTFNIDGTPKEYPGDQSQNEGAMPQKLGGGVGAGGGVRTTDPSKGAQGKRSWWDDSDDHWDD